MNDPKFSPEKTDGFILCVKGHFMEYPILLDKYASEYIYCDGNWSDAKAIKELYNEENSEYMAQFPVHKDFTLLPGYFIHLLPKYYNTN